MLVWIRSDYFYFLVIISLFLMKGLKHFPHSLYNFPLLYESPDSHSYAHEVAIKLIIMMMIIVIVIIIIITVIIIIIIIII